MLTNKDYMSSIILRTLQQYTTATAGGHANSMYAIRSFVNYAFPFYRSNSQ